MSTAADVSSPRALTSQDAQCVPIVAVDAHLPLLPAERLRPDRLRQRFRESSGRLWQPELVGDAAADVARVRASAAVLVPIVDRPSGAQVLLTRRAAHLRHHAGQISFPGGRVEPTDADRVETALREAQEEIGLGASGVEVLGVLPPYRTVTAFEVTPVVGLVRELPMFRLDPQEVDEVFEVPLAFLMNPAEHRRHAVDLGGGRVRHFLSMHWRPLDRGSADYFIWGATAAMLRNLYRYLQD